MLLRLAALQTGARSHASPAWPSAASLFRRSLMKPLVSTLAADVVAACSTVLLLVQRSVAAVLLAPTSVLLCCRHHPP